jgi:hypothetical protein
VGAEEFAVISESVGENLRIRKIPRKMSIEGLQNSIAEFALTQIAYTQIQGLRRSCLR